MQPDQLLLACPSCQGWPMAIQAVETAPFGKMGPRTVRFACGACGHHVDRVVPPYSEDRIPEASERPASAELATGH